MEEKKRSPLLTALGVGCGCLILICALACAGVLGTGLWLNHEIEAEQAAATAEAEAYAKSSSLVTSKVGAVSSVAVGTVSVYSATALVELTVVGALGAATVEVSLSKADDRWKAEGCELTMGYDHFEEGTVLEAPTYSSGGGSDFDWD